MAKQRCAPTPSEWAEVRHFKPADFSCKCGHCNGRGIPIDMDLVTKLDHIAEAVQAPLIVKFGVRCQVAQDRKAGGPSASPHVPHGDNHLATAVDIHCPDPSFRHKVLRAALFSDIQGIGIGSNFIHLEIHHRKGEVCWIYGPGR